MCENAQRTCRGRTEFGCIRFGEVRSVCENAQRTRRERAENGQSLAALDLGRGGAERV